MASKKRRSYRGVGPQHRKAATSALSAMRFQQREFKRQLAKGDCRMALYALTDARYKQGEYNSEMIWSTARTASGAARALGEMEQRFAKKCLR